MLRNLHTFLDEKDNSRAEFYKFVEFAQNNKGAVS
jgi:hypothetical protein